MEPAQLAGKETGEWMVAVQASPLGVARIDRERDQFVVWRDVCDRLHWHEQE